MEDTIAAIATSSGIASIGIIRISGKETFEITRKIFDGIKKEEVEGNTIKYGHIIYNNEIIDEVLVSFFVAPKSFTKENVCEINCHGGIGILNKILQIVLKEGARLAEPGEFTKRAFLNGRIDLSQAEAVIDIINSKTEKMEKESQKQLQGNLSKKVNEIEDNLLSVISDIEANIDYPEYDIEEISREKAKGIIIEIKNKLDKLIGSFESGKILKDGVKICIVGKPNVGKSSILNMLLKQNRAIVTDIAGTTRDTIEEDLNIKGILINIMDTAGIRNTSDTIEKIGIEKAIDSIKEADIAIGVFDYSNEFEEEDLTLIELIKEKKNIIVLNKNDLGVKIENKKILENNEFKNIIEMSTRTDNELNILEDKIYELINLDENVLNNEVVITNVRHKDVLNRATKEIDRVVEEIDSKIPMDILSIRIMDVLKIVGEISGKTISEEIIKTIFSKFCLGK